MSDATGNGGLGSVVDVLVEIRDGVHETNQIARGNSARLDKVTDRLDEATKVVASNTAAIMHLRNDMVRGFERVDERFEQVDDRFDRLGRSVDQRFAQVDQRFAQVDQRFAQVDQRFVETHELIEETNQRLAGLRDIFGGSVRGLERRVSRIEAHLDLDEAG